LKIVGAENLILDTVKRGEDDEDVKGDKTVEMPKKKGRSVICRVYDSMGGKSKATLSWGVLPVTKAYKCNILEDDLEEVEVDEDGKGMEIEVRAFEVASYRLVLKS
jgi:alpha-mannosidase